MVNSFLIKALEAMNDKQYEQTLFNLQDLIECCRCGDYPDVKVMLEVFNKRNP